MRFDEMVTRGPAQNPLRLTGNQREVLLSLGWWGVDNWVRPMDVGGRGGTHHSQVLNALVLKGLAESRWRCGPGAKWARGSKIYRITPKGVEYFELLQGPVLRREKLS